MKLEREIRPPLNAVGAVDTALRKARWRVIPLLAVCYCVAYIDRVNVSFAALQMNRDLHFNAAVYGFGSGIFFLSYALCEVPSNALLLRFGARRWLSRIMLTWGLLAMVMVFVRSPAGFYAARLLLGAAEAGFFPGVMYYLTLWFPRDMRGRVVSLFYIALPLSGTFMGSVAGFLLHLNGRLGLRGWQWLFLLEGLPAVLLGGALLRYLPDGPASAVWLSRAECEALTRRIEDDHATVRNPSRGVWAALLDLRVWQVGLFGLCGLTVSYAYSFTAPLMLGEATALSIAQIGWVVAALGLVGAAAMLAIAWMADHKPSLAYIGGCTMTMAAGCVGVGLQQGPVSLIGSLLLLVIGFYGMQGPYWTLPVTFLSGPSAAGGLAVIAMMNVLGGFIGPYALGVSKQITGEYRASMLILGLVSALSFLLILRRAGSRDQGPGISKQRQG